MDAYRLGLMMAALGSLALATGCGGGQAPLARQETLPAAAGQSAERAAPEVQGLPEHAATLEALQLPPGTDPALGELLLRELSRLGIDPLRSQATVASGEANRVFDLGLELPESAEGAERPGSVLLSWTERLAGDYDGNGEVNAADLTPLAREWNAAVAYDDPALHGGISGWPSGDPAGAGARNWLLARVDGDGNGLINQSDITPIAVHWKERLSGYLLERAVNRGDGSYSWEELSPLPGAQLVPRELADDGSAWQYRLEVPLAATDLANGFRVRPHDSLSGESGPYSLVAEYLPDPGVDTTPPYWLDGVGVQSVLGGDGSALVSFGAANDSQSPPVRYRVYWQQAGSGDAPFDIDNARYITVDASPALLSGLANHRDLQVAVRALDSAEPANLERNSVVLGSVVQPRDEFAPVWQARPGLDDVYYGNGRAVLFWEPASDRHEASGRIWSSYPLLYSILHGPGRSPQPEQAERIEVPAEFNSEDGFVIEGLDTAQAHWFMLQVRDSAEPPNTQWNDNYIMRRGMRLTSSRHELERRPGLHQQLEILTNPEHGGFGILQQVSRASSEAAPCGIVHLDYSVLTDEGLEQRWAVDPDDVAGTHLLAMLDDAGEPVVACLPGCDDFHQPLLRIWHGGEELEYSYADPGLYVTGLLGWIFDVSYRPVIVNLELQSLAPLQQRNMLHSAPYAGGQEIRNTPPDEDYVEFVRPNYRVAYGDGSVGLLVDMFDKYDGNYPLTLRGGADHALQLSEAPAELRDGWEFKGMYGWNCTEPLRLETRLGDEADEEGRYPRLRISEGSEEHVYAFDARRGAPYVERAGELTDPGQLLLRRSRAGYQAAELVADGEQLGMCLLENPHAANYGFTAIRGMLRLDKRRFCWLEYDWRGPDHFWLNTVEMLDE
ncbi:MAG: hypothetical protein R3F46_01140 [bacterium]